MIAQVPTWHVQQGVRLLAPPAVERKIPYTDTHTDQNRHSSEEQRTTACAPGLADEGLLRGVGPYQPLYVRPVLRRRCDPPSTLPTLLIPGDREANLVALELGSVSGDIGASRSAWHLQFLVVLLQHQRGCSPFSHAQTPFDLRPGRD